MNKIISLILVCFSITTITSQTAFHNFGNVQIHDEGQVGFHIDLINDGNFDDNLGIAGFYNQNNSLKMFLMTYS